MTNKVKFFTFCVDINRHTREKLILVFDLFLKCLEKHNPNYELICYTNFNLKENIPKYENVYYREYYDKSSFKLYKNDPWKNLSFNKINIYKDLHDETSYDYIWIDLDTMVLTDVSYFNDMDHFFISSGGEFFEKNFLFENNNNLSVCYKEYIQGDLWKLNIDLYNKLMKTLKEDILHNNLVLKYDLQDLFNYYVYHCCNKDKENNNNTITFNILGKNIYKDTLYGLSVWSSKGNTHANLNGFNNIFFDGKKFKSKFYPDKSIDVLSFTFFTFNDIFNVIGYKLHDKLLLN